MLLDSFLTKITHCHLHLLLLTIRMVIVKLCSHHLGHHNESTWLYSTKCVTRRSFYQIPGKSSAPNRSSMNSERCIIRLIKKMFQFILKVSAFCHFESECESVKILQTGTMTNQMTVDGQICWKIARLLPAYEHILRKNLIRLSFFGSQFNFFCVLVRARCFCLDGKANHTGDRV